MQDRKAFRNSLVRSASLRTTGAYFPGGVSKGEGPCPRPPSPWGLVSKGGGQGPRPLCRFKGVRGEIEIPPRFSLGGQGDILHGKAVLSMHRIAVLLFCLINLKWTETSTFCKSLLHRIKPLMDRNWFNLEGRMEQKIKQDINIGANIRAIRKQKNIKQVDLVRLLQLEGVEITRETLVKIESGVQHIRVSQLRGIRDALGTTYDELLK